VLITNHVLSGALVGRLARSTGAAFGLGVVSHFVLDTVPHWGNGDIHDNLGVAVPDGLIGLAAMAGVLAITDREERVRVLAGMTGACLPDLDKPSIVFFGRSPYPARFDRFHGLIQRESPRRMPQEVLVALAGAAAVALHTRRGRRLSSRMGG
jgi:hypothetical protein